jgi:hypothetical protein
VHCEKGKNIIKRRLKKKERKEDREEKKKRGGGCYAQEKIRRRWEKEMLEMDSEDLAKVKVKRF